MASVSRIARLSYLTPSGANLFLAPGIWLTTAKRDKKKPILSLLICPALSGHPASAKIEIPGTGWKGEVQMVEAAARTLTLEGFLQQPETKPASEYIDGQVIQKPMPQGKHSTLQGELVPAINAIVKPKRLARAFPELRCTFGGRSTVPDIAVFVWSRIPRDPTGEVANTFALPPDWTIEILSPDQSQTKVTKNILHCLKHGTQRGWLIDPDEQTLFVYYPNQEPEVFDTLEALFPVPSFASEVQLTVTNLFAWFLE
jgi:Uma2 family endonuclease